MNTEMSDEINEALLQKILQQNGTIPHIKRFDIIRNAVSAGNNYCSEIMKLRVDYTVDDESRQKCFVLKVPCQVPAYQLFAEHGMYDKETFMYEHVLPTLYQSLGFNAGPEHYHTTARNSLLLEDLGACGYRMEDRNEQLDFEQCQATLRSLAAFHAATYHLHRRNPALITAVAHETYFTHRSYVKDRLEAGLERWSRIARTQQPSSGFIRRLPTLIDEILRQLPLILSASIFDFNVLNHGDLWTTNVLFKHDRDGRIEAKMIDFQNCRWTSPAVDLILFATTSVKFDVYENRFEELLQAYVATLNRCLASLGHPTRYTMEQLKSDLEKAKLFRIVILGTYLNVTLSHPDSLVVFEKSDDQLTAKNIDSTYDSENYKMTMSKWLKYLDKNDLY